jgi:choline dehydrogenase
MIYNKGTIGSMQAWADLVDNQSWTFDNVLPYFARGIRYSPANETIRAANATVPPPRNSDVFNERSGPLEVSHPNFAQIFSTYLNTAMAK